MTIRLMVVDDHNFEFIGAPYNFGNELSEWKENIRRIEPEKPSG